MGLTVGWFLLDNGAKKIKLEDWEIDILTKNVDKQELASDERFGFYLGEVERRIRGIRTYFDTQADAEEFIALMKTLNANGAWKFEIQTASGGSKLKIDGTNTYANVICSSIRGWKKVAKGDGTTYMIKQLEFLQFAST